jgi:Glycosyl transferase family 11.
MKIVMINGGLGNQLFQYIFYRTLCEKQNENCYLDDSFFFREKIHNGYEIEKIFDVRPKKLSDYFEQDIWKFILEEIDSGKNICNVIQENGIELKMISETNQSEIFNYKGKYFTTPVNEYNPSILEIGGNIYYYGYWINREWFKSAEDIIRKEFTFREIEDAKNKELLNLIKNSNSVGVHVRRGDFIDYGWILPEDYYYQSVKKIINVVEKPLFFIFSDDIKWCLNNYRSLGFDFCRDNIIFVDGNVKGRNYIDMQLMSNCKNLIIANSSFSYLSALLNRNSDKIVINPISWRKI